MEMETQKTQVSLSEDNAAEEPYADQDSSVSSSKKSKLKYLLIVGMLVIIIGLWAANIFYKEKPQQVDVPSIQSPASQQMEIGPSYNEAIDEKTQLIDRIQKSVKESECLNLNPLFHSFDYPSRTMYFATYDELILPDCQNIYNHKWSVSRENLKVWNKYREVTEWAFQHVKPGNKVLYYRPQAFNLAQTTILSKLVGREGRLVILKSRQSKECMPSILRFNSLPDNVEYYEEPPSLSIGKYDVVIGNDTVFNYKIEDKVAADAKMLIYSTDIIILRINFGRYRIDSFKLESKECGRGVYEVLSMYDSGYFSFTAGAPMPERRVFKKSPAENKLLAAIEQQFISYKLEYVKKQATEIEKMKMFDQRQVCRSPNSVRQGQGYVVTTYGHKLYGVPLKQLLQWQGKREAVEWLRSKQSLLQVYFEVRHAFNLFAIVEMARLIPDGMLYVVCSKEECEKVEQQSSKGQLNNVVTLSQTSIEQALLAGAIITDNEALIKEALASDYAKKHALLGHFTHTRNESLKAMRQIYVRHRLKEVHMPQSAKHCAGFQFLHFFWNSSHPHNFYEITPSKYVVYSFWGGPPDNVHERKSLIMNEMARLRVQFKILTQQLFLYFQIKQYPIHAAFYLLTSIQKSDFVRFYMMHTYGGGYADVKHYHFDWKPYFQRMEKNETLYAIGYPQKHPLDMGCHDEQGLVPPCSIVRAEYRRIIGNSHYIFKKGSPLTRDWYNAAIANLDNKLEALRQNPPQVPRQFINGNFALKNGTKFISKYPFRWAEIANEHLARACYKHLDFLSTNLPYVVNEDYRTEQNLNEN